MLLASLRDAVARGGWAVARLVSPTTHIGHLEFIFVRQVPRTLLRSQTAALERALEQVYDAGPEWRTLLEANLRFVASGIYPHPFINVACRGYGTRFSHYEATNPTFLACRLVWAAKCIELWRMDPAGRPEHHSRLAHAETLRLARGFADSGPWLQYLHPDNWSFRSSAGRNRGAA